jgi:hypothetical protein
MPRPKSFPRSFDHVVSSRPAAPEAQADLERRRLLALDHVPTANETVLGDPPPWRRAISPIALPEIEGMK